MKCAIMQPTYLPWAGYFNLASQVDCFVFLDDVQFEKRSWQSRNRVLNNGQINWLTVPVKYVSQNQLINTVEVVDEENWRKKHIRLLEHGYAKHPYKCEMLKVMEILDDCSLTYLQEINISLIRMLSERLGVVPYFVRASDLMIGGKRSEHLYRICEKLGCNEYLSPAGSFDYLIEEGIFANGSIKLKFQNYTPGQYVQPRTKEFVSHLSIIDIVANIGWEAAAEYIRG